MSSSRSFLARSETFGLETEDPWALAALRLLYSAPRVYEPLQQAWEARNPGSAKALSRLVESGFAQYQPGVVVDTRDGTAAQKPSRKVKRLRITSKGKRLLAAGWEDARVLEDAYPRMAASTSAAVLDLLNLFTLPDGQQRFGRSIPHAVASTTLPDSVAKWWIARWEEEKILKELPDKIADVREVVPAHWRPTRALSKQLKEAVDVFPSWAGLSMELRLNRRNYLTDIDPARVGASGATDFDHDVECQRILAQAMYSPSFDEHGYLCVEPRIVLPLETQATPFAFRQSGGGTCFYQPDTEYREHASDGSVVRAVLEYERFQTRRDAWNHVERYLGYLSLRTLSMEASILRFVVDTKTRERGYVELIEAFADYGLDHPERMPANPVRLAVSSTPRLRDASDALDPANWFTIVLEPGRADPESREAVLHDSDDSPYDEYFGRESGGG